MLEGQAADMIMKTGLDYSLKVSEKAAKLSWLGAARLAILLVALFSDKNKVAGLTNLKRLIQEDKSPAVIPISRAALSEFKALCKRYGVLFAVVATKNSDRVDVIFDSAKVGIVNRVFQAMGYHPDIEVQVMDGRTEEEVKNSVPLAQSSKELKQRGEPYMQENAPKPSVVKRVEVAKSILESTKYKEEGEPEK